MKNSSENCSKNFLGVLLESLGISAEFLRDLRIHVVVTLAIYSELPLGINRGVVLGLPSRISLEISPGVSVRIILEVILGNYPTVSLQISPRVP